MKKAIPWDLIIPHLKKTSTAGEEARLKAWLSDEDHRAAYADICAAWELIRAKVSGYHPDKDYYWRELQKRMKQAEAARRPRRLRLGQWRKYAAAACLAAMVACVSYYAGRSSSEERVVAQSYVSVGGKSKATLPDGSKIWLHSQSSLAYTNTFSLKERCVHLTGEALFDVAHDEERPFVVEAGGMKIRVHGTRFNVRTMPGRKKVAVSLLRGSVSVETPREQRLLVPGEMAVYDQEKQRLAVEKSDVEFAASWAKDQLQFDNRPLEEIARYLSRWYDVDIEVDGALGKKYSYTFTLRGEPLEEILRIMSRIHPMDYAFTGENKLIIRDIQ